MVGRIIIYDDGYLLDHYAGNNLLNIQDLKELRTVINKQIRLGKDKIELINFKRTHQFYEQLENSNRSTKSIKKPKIGKIYIVTDRTHQFIKIGWSGKPKIREYTLQAQKPTLTIVKTFDGTVPQEKEVHKLLAEYRIRGEWFDVTLEQAENAIQGVLNNSNNNPTQITNQT